MTTLPPELAALPAPQVVAEIAYDATRTRFIDKLKALFAAVGIDWDVGALVSDPGVILMEAASSMDVNLRQRINEAVQATMLPYSSGADLDILAQFYDVTRLAGEADVRLRIRVVQAIRGRSTGGTEARYRSIALGADIRVADVTVYTIGRDPTVHVAVFASDNNGVPDEALIATVDAALQSPTARMVNDRIVVSPAARQTLSITVNVWLLPQTSNAVTIAMEASLRAAWARDITLGRDVTRAWLVGQLMLDGVQRVEILAPSIDVIVPFDQAVALGVVKLTVVGRDF